MRSASSTAIGSRNPTVLSFVRRFGDDIVLCVNNLSRFPQPVELDLRRFDGYVSGPLAEDFYYMIGGYISSSPGIRDAGYNSDEGNQITVRGLSGQYTRIRVNGMETRAVTSVLGTANLGNRGFDFNLFASELFNSGSITTNNYELNDGQPPTFSRFHTVTGYDDDGNFMVRCFLGLLPYVLK